MKYVVILCLIAILASLGSALFYMVRDKDTSTRTIKALSVRVGLSIFLFILLWFAFYMGWLVPHQL